MSFRPILRFRQLVCASLLCTLAVGVQAVELGDVAVRSYIGQPLIADIELTALAPDEMSALQVRLANPDVYRGANVAINPALATLHMSVMRRDKRQFLHLTSIKPVEAQYVHLFLELLAANRSVVRGTTIWLTVDPRPPAPVHEPEPEPEPEPLPEHASAPVSPAMAAALARAGMPLAHAAPHARVTHSAGYSAAQNKTCLALDVKNATLTAQIVELEAKIKALQETIEVKPEPVEAPVPKAPVPGKVPKALDKKADKKAEGLPWLWIGSVSGVALLLALVAVFVMRARKKGQGAVSAAKPGLFARLFGGKKKHDAAVAAVPEEPKLS